MFICGFISFTVWSSFTVRIISLSHSHIPPLRPVPAPSHSTLPAPSMAIKILSATLLKNYRAFPFIRVLLVVLLEKIPLAHANWVQTCRVPSSPSSGYIVSLSFLVRLGLSVLRPRRATVSTIRFLFRVYSLLGCLFPLVACICPILSPFVYLVLVHTVLGVSLSSIPRSPYRFHSLCLVTSLLPCLSSFICPLLFSADILVYLSPFTLFPLVSHFLSVTHLLPVSY